MNVGEQVSDSSKILCSGSGFERKLCQCPGKIGSFQKRSIIKENRNLRIIDIRESESGFYYCSRDDGTTSTPNNEHIVSRAEIVVVPMTATRFVSNFTLQKTATEGSLAIVGLGSEVQLVWDVFDELPCTGMRLLMRLLIFEPVYRLWSLSRRFAPIR